MKEVKTNSLRAWGLAARPKTLTAAAVPVMTGSTLAATDLETGFRWVPCLLCFLFAFIMQIDANFINDYFDFKKGSDRADRLGPLRACAQGWITGKAMKQGIVITTLLACLCGLPLLYYGDKGLIVIGVLCVIFAFLYTTTLSYLGLGDILVLVFFGIIPVGITYYLQTSTWTWETTLASLACGCVIDTLLIVNNFRDRDQDKLSGKQTIVVRWGVRAGSLSYLFLGLLPCLACLSFLINGHLWAAILPLLYLFLHLKTWRQMIAIYQGKALNRILGLTARNIFIFGLLLSLGFLLHKL